MKFGITVPKHLSNKYMHLFEARDTIRLQNSDEHILSLASGKQYNKKRQAWISLGLARNRLASVHRHLSRRPERDPWNAHGCDGNSLWDVFPNSVITLARVMTFTYVSFHIHRKIKMQVAGKV